MSGHTLYLHMGFAKCASTSLQRWLFDNESFWSQQGFLLPRCGIRFEQHWDFFSTVRAADREAMKALAAELRDEINASGHTRTIITSEQLSLLLHDELPALAELFAEAGITEIRTLCLLRSPAALIDAMYRFGVANQGSTARWHQHVRQHARVGTTAFAQTLSAWQCATRGTLTVDSLERIGRTGSDVFSAFTEFLEVSVAPPPLSTRLNVSISPLQVLAMYNLNREHWRGRPFDIVKQRAIRARVTKHPALRATDVSMLDARLTRRFDRIAARQEHLIWARFRESAEPLFEPSKPGGARLWPPQLSAAEARAIEQLIDDTLHTHWAERASAAARGWRRLRGYR